MTTNEVSAQTGATLRELQLWHEHGYVSPKQDKHGWRVWSEHDVRVAKWIKALRRQHIALRAIRPLLPLIQCATAGEMWVVRNGGKAHLAKTLAEAHSKALKLGAIRKVELK